MPGAMSGRGVLSQKGVSPVVGCAQQIGASDVAVAPVLPSLRLDLPQPRSAGRSRYVRDRTDAQSALHIS